jgi:pyridinium-3,5-biscarboxylic acid mononucleotide synthase
MHQGSQNEAEDGELDLGLARLDLGRGSRTGVPEAVLAEGKSDDELAVILDALVQRGQPFLATRFGEDRASRLLGGRPGLVFERRARVVHSAELPLIRNLAQVPIIVSAGTSDRGVAEEAYWTFRVSGIEAGVVADVGVAGLHRLERRIHELRRAAVILVVAGMEGALASVLAGLVPCPLIAVPTSVGYGASFGGVAALLGMLNSCAPGVTVCNIDNGFGAAAAAIKMLNMTSLSEKP